MLAVWNYIDPIIITQPQSNTEAVETVVMTPRSVITERIHESPAVDMTQGLFRAHRTRRRTATVYGHPRSL